MHLLEKFATNRLTTFNCPSFQQGKYNEADASYVRAISMGRRTLGTNHPELAGWLSDRAMVMAKKVNDGMGIETAGDDGALHEGEPARPASDRIESGANGANVTRHIHP